MSDQHKATGEVSDFDGGPMPQPKPTGEWTARHVDSGMAYIDFGNGTTSGWMDKRVVGRIVKESEQLREKYKRSQEKVKEYFDLLATEREKVERMTKAYMVCNQDWQDVTEQLASERDKANVRETELICERDYFKKELAAEREKSRAGGWLSQEALDEYAKVEAEVQQLREQLAAAQHPLVNALIKIANDPHCDRCQVAVDALAKVAK